ncbi:MAG: helicase C-terminal domain-containing protein [Synechococcales bacterium]|nr:helicase C-terminal domain-containing protein [Synechococcales bacterium]
MIEVEVHQQLRAFLREQGEPHWPHHLTMARLVARALRLERSALIQAGAPSGYDGRYRLSYLVPALIWPEPVLLVVPDTLRQRLLMVEIPRLKQWITVDKPIQTGDRWPYADFQGLLLTSPHHWLGDRLNHEGRFPKGIPAIIDGVDDLEDWTRQHLTTQISPQHWDDLMLACPAQADRIRDARVQLTRSIFQHPVNPYECHLLDAAEQDTLRSLQADLETACSALDAETEGYTRCHLPPQWKSFFEHFHRSDQLIWTEIRRPQGQFSLHCSPIDIAPALELVWEQQPFVMVGGVLDQDPDATLYRQRVGLDDITCLKFSPDRQSELIHLYLPERMPMPNTPQFQPALLQEIRQLLVASAPAEGPTVILVGDVPLKAQVGATLAAEFGSRVQLERTCLDDNGILVTGWQFWRTHQAVLPAPRLLIITTLPVPSLEDPRVAGRVAYYKRRQQNWFRLYLLPETLNELHRAIAPVRDTQGVVALLDNRVNHRSYGTEVLEALSPLARINYLDDGLFFSEGSLNTL